MDLSEFGKGIPCAMISLLALASPSLFVPELEKYGHMAIVGIFTRWYGWLGRGLPSLTWKNAGRGSFWRQCSRHDYDKTDSTRTSKS